MFVTSHQTVARKPPPLAVGRNQYIGFKEIVEDSVKDIDYLYDETDHRARPDSEAFLIIRKRVVALIDSYAPPTDPDRDTFDSGVEDGKLAVTNTLEHTRPEARKETLSANDDVYFTDRFIDELKARLRYS